MTNHYSGSVTPVTVATDTAKPPVEVGAGPGNIAITLDGETPPTSATRGRSPETRPR